MKCIHWLDACPDPAAAGVGGKGGSLALLSKGGFPVPAGFVIGADGYRVWVDYNNLRPQIDAVLAVPNLRLPKVAREAVTYLQEATLNSTLPPDLQTEVLLAYGQLRDRRGPELVVAVRSSALSEDGTASSSAGLYETYLNVRDQVALLESLLRCYQSLWAHRAVQYRAFKNIDSNREAMGVVVMEMVTARVSGVAFTVNPVTGNRNEIMINASWGLGEAIVSGRVTPDSFVVRKDGLKLITRDVFEKDIMVLPDPAGVSGTVTVEVPPDRRSAPALSDGEVADIAEMCTRIERYYGGPQDVEWALMDDELYILQSRPVTGLS